MIWIVRIGGQIDGSHIIEEFVTDHLWKQKSWIGICRLEGIYRSLKLRNLIFLLMLQYKSFIISSLLHIFCCKTTISESLNLEIIPQCNKTWFLKIETSKKVESILCVSSAKKFNNPCAPWFLQSMIYISTGYFIERVQSERESWTINLYRCHNS